MFEFLSDFFGFGRHSLKTARLTQAEQAKRRAREAREKQEQTQEKEVVLSEVAAVDKEIEDALKWPVNSPVTPLLSNEGSQVEHWEYVFFHGAAERLFWNLDPEDVARLKSAPDRVSSDIAKEEMEEGVHKIEIEYLDDDGEVQYEDGLLFLWLSTPAKHWITDPDEMGGKYAAHASFLKGLVVLENDGEALNYARSMYISNAPRI